jgi:hypothetical protein
LGLVAGPQERNDLQPAGASVAGWRFGSLDDLLGRPESVEHVAYRRFAGGLLLGQRSLDVATNSFR